MHPAGALGGASQLTRITYYELTSCPEARVVHHICSLVKAVLPRGLLTGVPVWLIFVCISAREFCTK